MKQCVIVDRARPLYQADHYAGHKKVAGGHAPQAPLIYHAYNTVIYSTHTSMYNVSSCNLSHLVEREHCRQFIYQAQAVLIEKNRSLCSNIYSFKS